MPSQSKFPHLQLAFRGTFAPKFSGGGETNTEVKANKSNSKVHAHKIRDILDQMRQDDAQKRQERQVQGLPEIPADKGFLLRLPEGEDIDDIVHALGGELVAETDEGYVLASTEDLVFEKLEEVLSKFEMHQVGGGMAASLLDFYSQEDEPKRLERILTPEVLALWPFEDATTYTFDLGIQTATSTRDMKWPRVKKRKAESDLEFERRKAKAREDAWDNANREWDDKADERVGELHPFIQHYSGEIISGMISDPAQQSERGMVFPDSVQVRVRMNGAGFKDVILNFAHLFEVALPEEVQREADENQDKADAPTPAINSPAPDAPAVCVIDSGIQEGHRWLEPAIDSVTSRCFLPDVEENDVADYVRPQGHGTGVAGAVLYPYEIPKTGTVTPVAWIQNARVLDNENVLPIELTPEDYLHRVITHFHTAPRFTKIFNHSINERVACHENRMTAWAAKLDQLSHEKDVLFIQSAGNQSKSGLMDLLADGKLPPEHYWEDAMRVANPAQSLHALTVGSVSGAVFDDDDQRSFAAGLHRPSGFSRAGYGQPWSVVKPEVVEIGGDFVFEKEPPHIVRNRSEVAIELLNSTMHGQPAYSKDGVGTSFAAPKVAHIAAHLQNLFPIASPLLYRALIVQSARWPQWAEREARTNTDKVLRLIGYGLPSLERATTNSAARVTLTTPDAVEISSKKLHLYTVRIPEGLRNAALEAKIRVDVTLAYTALPRRTRSRRTGYLETWLDWEASRLREPQDVFLERMQEGGFAQSEFIGAFTLGGLLSAIRSVNISIPNAASDIEALNKLLAERNLYAKLPNVNLSTTALELKQRVAKLQKRTLMKLNRMILESAFTECPKSMSYTNFPWILHTNTNSGDADETSRNRGTVQKDWAVFDSYNIPEEFSIAVRAHVGWNHRDGEAKARYCLVVSFEVGEGEVPIYALIEAENRVEVESEIQT